VFLMSYPLWVKVTAVTLLAVCGLLLVIFKPNFPIDPVPTSSPSVVVNVGSNHTGNVAGRDVIIYSGQTDAQKEATLELQANLERERTTRIKLENNLAPRRLTESDKNALIKVLKPFAGQKCLVSSILGDSEGKAYADDFVQALDGAGWDHGGDRGITYNAWSVNPSGLQIVLHQRTQNTGDGNPAIAALINVTKALGLIDENGVKLDPQIPSLVVQFRIGTKPVPRN